MIHGISFLETNGEPNGMNLGRVCIFKLCLTRRSHVFYRMMESTFEGNKREDVRGLGCNKLAPFPAVRKKRVELNHDARTVGRSKVFTVKLVVPGFNGERMEADGQRIKAFF